MNGLRSRLTLFFMDGDTDWLLIFLFVPAMLVFIVIETAEQIIEQLYDKAFRSGKIRA